MSTKSLRSVRRPHVRIYNSAIIEHCRAYLALGLAALIFFAPLSLTVSAHTNSGSEGQGANKIVADQQGNTDSPVSVIHGFIIESVNGTVSCRNATAEELPFVMAGPNASREKVKFTPPKTSDINQNNAMTQSGDQIGSGGLTINLHALSQLQADSNRAQVEAAFTKAAQYWTDRIKSPVVVDIDIDYGPNRPGGGAFPTGVLGSTGSGSVKVDYAGVRQNLIASANSSDGTVYNSLPASALPIDIGNGGLVDVSSSVAKALGIVPAGTTASIATIAFNKGFQFDFDPSDGIAGNKTDFVAVATHEIGHALGFVSGAGEGAAATPTTWDLFRLRPGTTAGAFTTAQRVMTKGLTDGTSGNEQVFYTGRTYNIAGVGPTTDLGLSTGGPSGTGGDGSQSSHWKADELSGAFIGIMDPTIAKGDLEIPTENDYGALEAIGWDLVGGAPIPPAPPAPPPPANDNIANAQNLPGCSGSVVGLNIGATKEAGEPNNPESPTSARSVWYQWTAPSTGVFTVDTVGSGFDTVLAAYNGSSFGGGFSLITSNDDNEDPNTSDHEVSSLVSFTATQGQTYSIEVNGFNNGGGADVGTIKLNWSAANCTVTPTPTPAGPATLALSASSYSISEGDTGGVLPVTVNRTGDASAAVSVDYTTSDQAGTSPCQTNTSGFASARCDYASAAGTVRFAAGDITPKIILIPLINDAYVEQAVESFTITLRNPQGAALGTSTATLVIQDNDAQAATTNPINSQDFFIKQQYIDFLGRIAEPAGFAFWMDRMTNCPAGQVCDRTDTAQRFFESDEFKERGFYVYKLYDALLGRFPLYASEFVPEVARLNGPQTPAEQRLGKDAYLLDFMTKTEFRNLYDQYLTTDHLHAKDAGNAAAFVDALCNKAGITPASKAQLVANLQNGTKDPAHTLEDFILTPEINGDGTKFYDRARIVMQYFGFLRRDPEVAGFDFWWARVATPGSPQFHDYRELVNNFLRSDEYNFRFAFLSAP